MCEQTPAERVAHLTRLAERAEGYAENYTKRAAARRDELAKAVQDLATARAAEESDRMERIRLNRVRHARAEDARIFEERAAVQRREREARIRLNRAVADAFTESTEAEMNERQREKDARAIAAVKDIDAEIANAGEIKYGPQSFSINPSRTFSRRVALILSNQLVMLDALRNLVARGEGGVSDSFAMRRIGESFHRTRDELGEEE